jgi:hypothetical protein
LASNYNKLIENAAFFMAYEKRKNYWIIIARLEDVQADIDKKWTNQLIQFFLNDVE